MIHRFAPILSYTSLSALEQFHVERCRMRVENNWHTQQEIYNAVHKTYLYKTSKNKK